jgi:glucose-6-phosphate 1-dehydrogenase
VLYFRYKDLYNPDAYTRLLLEALRGNQSGFVRTDELLAAWKIFTPLLELIEKATKHPDEVDPAVLQKCRPIPYKYGSRGPAEAEEMIAAAGMRRAKGYKWGTPK